MLFHDESYVFYLFPSIISFTLSSVVIFQVISSPFRLGMRFHQLCLLTSLFADLQCISVFIGPRYEESTELCKFQEYLFQIGTMNQGIVAILMSKSVFYTIRYGKLLRWTSAPVLSWILFASLLTILSIAFRTAKLFCPFDGDNEFPIRKMGRSNEMIVPFVAYWLVYITPCILSIITTLYYYLQSAHYALQTRDTGVIRVARQLRMLPVALSVCILPLFTWLVFVMFTHFQNRVMLAFAAMLASSSGSINAIFYHHYLANSETAFRESSLVVLLGAVDSEREDTYTHFHHKSATGAQLYAQVQPILNHEREEEEEEN